MFLHNICYYYFAVSLYFDKNNDNNNTINTIGIISFILCLLESILISLTQFELKEKIIPFTNELIPVGILQVIFEYFVNLPMIVIFIYYYYYIFDTNGKNDINNSIYICFVAYILLCIYKCIAMLFGHYEQFYSYKIENSSSVKSIWKTCIALHVCNWAIGMPTVLITFGAIYLNNYDKNEDNNEVYSLSIATIVIGCVFCCCLTCLGWCAITN